MFLFCIYRYLVNLAVWISWFWSEELWEVFVLQLFMGRPLRVAPSRQFARLQTKEGLHSDETSDDLNINAEEADTADVSWKRTASEGT